MRTKGEQGVSPFMLAEKRGKIGLLIPLLRAYHFQVRKRYLLRQCGDRVDDVSHPYLTAKLLQYRDSIFRPGDLENEEVLDVQNATDKPELRKVGLEAAAR